jgi:hypothetical protein
MIWNSSARNLRAAPKRLVAASEARRVTGHDAKEALQLKRMRCVSGQAILREPSLVQHRHDSNGPAAAAADFHRQGEHNKPGLGKLIQVGNVLKGWNILFK